jgi:hypothetical protein
MARSVTGPEKKKQIKSERKLPAKDAPRQENGKEQFTQRRR